MWVVTKFNNDKRHSVVNYKLRPLELRYSYHYHAYRNLPKLFGIMWKSVLECRTLKENMFSYASQSLLFEL